MALRLPRRSFLRGLGGIAIGLPVLEIMLNGSGTAYANGGALPTRYVVTFGGFSLGSDADGLPVNYAPSTVGPGYELTAPLASIATHGALQDEISVISGLQIPAGLSLTDQNLPPGGRTAEFHFHVPSILCGQRMVAVDDPNLEGKPASFLFNSDVTAPSSDQIVADALGNDSPFKSLVYRVQPSLYANEDDPYMARNKATLSFRDQGDGVSRIVPVVSPRLAYDTLFAGFVPDDPVEAAKKVRELAKRKSILDLVDRRMGGIVDKLGAADRIRLERHLDEIRILEQQLEIVDPSGTGACELPPDPGEDPPVGTPAQDWNVNINYSDEDGRARVFTDIVAMALTCGLTRVATLMYTTFQSSLNLHPLFGAPWRMHTANHSSDQGTMEKMLEWHVSHFANLVAKLRDTPEGDGSVLDNSTLVFLNEGGFGYDTAATSPIPNSSHSTENMVALLAGRAGGLRPGHHVVAPQDADHVANVLVSAMAAAGVQTDTLGEISGVIPGLFA